MCDHEYGAVVDCDLQPGFDPETGRPVQRCWANKPATLIPRQRSDVEERLGRLMQGERWRIA